VPSATFLVVEVSSMFCGRRKFPEGDQSAMFSSPYCVINFA
jgi:hypothetical protein